MRRKYVHFSTFYTTKLFNLTPSGVSGRGTFHNFTTMHHLSKFLEKHCSTVVYATAHSSKASSGRGVAILRFFFAALGWKFAPKIQKNYVSARSRTFIECFPLLHLVSSMMVYYGLLWSTIFCCFRFQHAFDTQVFFQLEIEGKPGKASALPALL